MSSATPSANPTSGTPWVNVVASSRQQRATSRPDATSTEPLGQDTMTSKRNSVEVVPTKTSSGANRNGSASQINGGGSSLQEKAENNGVAAPPSYSPIAAPGTTTAPKQSDSAASPKKQQAKVSAATTGSSSVAVYARDEKPVPTTAELKAMKILADEKRKTTTPTVAVGLASAAVVEQNKAEAPTILFIDIADVVKPKRGNLNRVKKPEGLDHVEGGTKADTKGENLPVINKSHLQAFEEIVAFLVSKDPKLERTLIVPTLRTFKESSVDTETKKKTGLANEAAGEEIKKPRRKPKKKVACTTNAERLVWLEQVMDCLNTSAAAKFRVVADRAAANAQLHPTPKEETTVASASLTYRDKLLAKSVAPTVAAPTVTTTSSSNQQRRGTGGKYRVNWEESGVNLRPKGGLPFFAPAEGAKGYPKGHRDWFKQHSGSTSGDSTPFNPSGITWMSIISKQAEHQDQQELLKEVCAINKELGRKVRLTHPANEQLSAEYEREAVTYLRETMFGPHCVVLVPPSTNILNRATAESTAASSDPLCGLGLLPKYHIQQLNDAWSMPLCVETRKKLASPNEDGEESENEVVSSSSAAPSSAASAKTVTALLGTTLRGFVKRFNPTRGFGFIHCRQFGGGVDVFVHQSGIVVPPVVKGIRLNNKTGDDIVDLKPSFRALNVGAEVTFQIKTVSVNSADGKEILTPAHPLEAVEVSQYRPPYVDTRLLSGLLLPAIRKSGLPNQRVASPPQATPNAATVAAKQRRSSSTPPTTKTSSLTTGRPPSAPRLLASSKGSKPRRMVPGGGPVPMTPPQGPATAPPIHGEAPPALLGGLKGAAFLAHQSNNKKSEKQYAEGTGGGGLPPPPPDFNQSVDPNLAIFRQQARLRMMNVVMGDPVGDNFAGWRNADGSVVYSNYYQQGGQQPVPQSTAVEHLPNFYDPAVLVATTARHQHHHETDYHQGAYSSSGALPTTTYHPSTYQYPQAQYQQQQQLFQMGQYHEEAAHATGTAVPRQRSHHYDGRQSSRGKKGNTPKKKQQEQQHTISADSRDRR